MVPRVVALPAEATVLKHGILRALQISRISLVDAEHRVIGIVDTDVFMESVLER
jgi:hypothetical protein